MGTGRVLGVQVLSVESGPGWQDTAPASHGSLKGKNVPGARPAGRREHAKHCSPRGGSTGQGSPGGSGPGISPPNHPLPRLSPWVLQGSWLTWPEWLALCGGGGYSQPRIPSLGWRPSPALMSAGLAAFQLIFCPMLCLPSGLLRGLGLVGGGTQTQPPRVTQRAACWLLARFHPIPRCRAAVPTPWCRSIPGPSLATHDGRGSPAWEGQHPPGVPPPFYPRDTVPPQLTVPSGAVPSAAPAAPAGSGSARTMPA